MGGKQKAVLVTSFDESKVNAGWANLEVGERDIPSLKNGEVLVRMALRPLNPTDFMLSRGYYGMPSYSPNFPFVPGSEGVGKVEKNGPGTSGKFKEGQRVTAGGWEDGTWQQYIAMPEKDLVAVPDQMDDQTAAQFYINPVTVYGMVQESDVPKGEWLLSNAASSTLGHMLVQYAKHEGIKTINVIRNDKHKPELEKLGADVVINSTQVDLLKEVHDVTGGKGAWAALDPVGGDATAKVVASTRKEGWTRLYGALAGTTATVGIIDLILHSRTLGSFVIYNWLPKDGHEKKMERLQKTMDLLLKGVMKPPPPHKSFPLEKVHDAINEYNKIGGGHKVFLEG